MLLDVLDKGSETGVQGFREHVPGKVSILADALRLGEDGVSGKKRWRGGRGARRRGGDGPPYGCRRAGRGPRRRTFGTVGQVDVGGMCVGQLLANMGTASCKPHHNDQLNLKWT